MRYFAALVLVMAFVTDTHAARSVVPDLDQSGHKGDVARKVKEKVLAQFDAADENKDGKLSREEVGKHSRYLTNSFDKRDIDKDGFLSWEEFLGHDRWSK